MNVRSFLLLLLLGWPALLAAQPFDHSGWDRLLQQRVNALGELDYAALAASPAPLEAYLAALAAASPDSVPRQFPTRDHQLAYWINAYNAFTVKGVLNRYPLDSVRRAGGFFRERSYIAGGAKVSLDDIEHRILRERHQEPRIHFAIVCASVSCPALSNRAVRAEDLDSRLNNLAREFVNQERNVYIDTDRGEVTLSKIFDWFNADFEAATGLKGAAATLAYIQPYAEQALAAALSRASDPKVRYFSYDWSLNRPGSRAASSNRFESKLAAESGVMP